MNTLQDKRVLVTGAGGFIGSHLTERLVEASAQVRALVRYTSRRDEGWLADLAADTRAQVEIVPGDVRDLETVRQAMRDVQVVFHLAALVGIPYSYQHPQEVIATNVGGTAHVLLAARDNARIERVLLTSTSEVYGTARRVPIDEAHPLQPQSPYAATKIAADALGLSFHHSFETPVVLVRPFNSYGPRQSMRAVIPTTIVQALTRDRVMLGALEPTRDFTYVTDTAAGFVQAATAPGAVGRAINLGTGREIAIGDLARRIVALIGRDVPVLLDPQRLRPAASEVERLCADSTLARELLGWEPLVALDDGLRRTIDWVRGALDRYRPDEYAV
ncbi:MAG: SDR family NAD(P)-dependent oxidoreductase [Chloroflexi bacterium]|nr:SDR family NAD(P)-dependent oxidoreductase [Chloroflexota bacterium]MBU1747093.1 SDR family NAD(P)-dependent oxidoreductase [Chloroflexota bacterium]